MMWGSGAGFYDQGAGYGQPVNRAMQGGGLQQQQQQQRFFLGSAEYQGGITRQSVQPKGMVHQTDFYNQGSYTEQPHQEDYYGRRFHQGGYGEEQGGYTEQQTDYWAEPEYSSKASYEPVAYDEQQYFDYAHGSKSNQPKIQQQQKGTSAAAATDKRGPIDQPRGLPEGGGWKDRGDWYGRQDAQAFLSQTQEPSGGVDYPRQQKSGINLSQEELGGVTRPRGQIIHRSANVANASKMEMEQPKVPRPLMGDSWQPSGQEEINTHRGISLGKEGKGLMDTSVQPARRLIDTQRDPKKNINQGMFDPPGGGRGLVAAPRDQRGQTRAMIDQGRLDRISNQRGLLESTEQRGLMDPPRSLLDLHQESPRDKQGLMSPPGANRGHLTAPKEQGIRTGPSARLQSSSGAIWDGRQETRTGARLGANHGGRQKTRRAAGPGANKGGGQETRRRDDLGTRQESRPGARQGASPGARQESRPGASQGASPGARQGASPRARQEARQGAGSKTKSRGSRNRKNRQANRNKVHSMKDLQLELMEKAGLQMKLLEEQQQQAQMEEMERMTLLQQQALLMQQQQQHLQQFQQQQQLQMLQEQQLYQQQQEAQLLLSGGRERNIPSIFEVPTKGSLGKRPGGPAGPSDNKRPRNRPEDRNRGSQADKRNDSRRLRNLSERQRQLQRDKKREKRRKKRLEQARQYSSSKNKRDGKDSGSAKNSTSQKSDRDRGAVKDNKGKGKGRATTEVTIDLKDNSKYDPAQPTSDDNKTTKDEKKKDENRASNKSEKTGDNKVEKNAAESTGKDESKGESKSEAKKEERKTERRDKDDRSRERTTNKETDDRPERKKYHCEVCSANCFNMENFDRHMNGRKHKLKVELEKGRVQAEEHLRQIESKKRSPARESNGKIGTYCKTCDRMYMGEYKSHKVTPAHKAREDRIKKGCKICNETSFSTFVDLTKHLESEGHKKNKRKLQIEEVEEDLGNLVTLDVVGFEEDSTKQKSDRTSSARKTSGSSPTSLKPEDEVIPAEYDPQTPVGLRYIVPVSGFFCKLCSKFCINEASAKVEHCQSQPHYEKLKETLAAKLMAKSMEASDKKDVDNTSEEKTNKTTTSNEGSTAASHVETEESHTSHNETLTGEVKQELAENKSTVELDTNQTTIKVDTNQSTVELDTNQSIVKFEDSQSTVLVEDNQTEVVLNVNQSTVELNGSQSAVELDANQATNQSNMEASNCEMTVELQGSSVVDKDQTKKEKEKCEITISINEGAEESSKAEAEKQNSQAMLGGEENSQAMEGGNENSQVDANLPMEGVDENAQVIEGVNKDSKLNERYENSHLKEGENKNSQLQKKDENSQVKEGGDESTKEIEQGEDSNNMEIEEGEENGLKEDSITEEGVEDKSQEDPEGDNEKSQEEDGNVVRGSVQKARRGRSARGRRGNKH